MEALTQLFLGNPAVFTQHEDPWLSVSASRRIWLCVIWLKFHPGEVVGSIPSRSTNEFKGLEGFPSKPFFVEYTNGIGGWLEHFRGGLSKKPLLCNGPILWGFTGPNLIYLAFSHFKVACWA